jgi:hypothetical protein
MNAAIDTSSRPRPYQSNHLLGAFLLAICAFGYFLFCIRSIFQRGYPPIEHFWDGATYTWIFALPLFALIVEPGRFSRLAILLYSLASGCIYSMTGASMTPKGMTWEAVGLNFCVCAFLMIAVAAILARSSIFRRILILLAVVLGCVAMWESLPYWLLLFFALPCFFFGMVFWGVSALLAKLSRMAFGALRISAKSHSPQRPSSRGLRVIAAVAIAAMGAAFPFAYGQIGNELDARAGRFRADADWASHTAQLYTRGGELDRDVGDCLIDYKFDPDLGFPITLDWSLGFEPGYNSRVRQLAAQRGIPDWSFKSRMVSDADLISMFAARDLNPIKKLPFDLTDSIVLWRGGDITRWGRVESGSNDPQYLCIAWRHYDVMSQFRSSLPGQESPICFGRLAKYPNVVFLRFSDDCIAAFATDGWLLESAWKQ